MTDEQQKKRREKVLTGVAEELLKEYGISREAVFGGGGILKELTRACRTRNRKKKLAVASVDKRRWRRWWKRTGTVD